MPEKVAAWEDSMGCAGSPPSQDAATLVLMARVPDRPLSPALYDDRGHPCREWLTQFYPGRQKPNVRTRINSPGSWQRGNEEMARDGGGLRWIRLGSDRAPGHGRIRLVGTRHALSGYHVFAKPAAGQEEEATGKTVEARRDQHRALKALGMGERTGLSLAH